MPRARPRAGGILAGVLLSAASLAACTKPADSQGERERASSASATPTPLDRDDSSGSAEPESGEPESGELPGDPYAGEAAHVIPFADRTSMGYLLLLPPDPERGLKQPELPSRARLRELVQAAFPDRRNDAELDLLYRLIETEPHATDIAFTGELRLPELDGEADEGASSLPRDESPAPAPEHEAKTEAELEAIAAKAERERAYDLLGLHIEMVRLGLGEDTALPTSVRQDPILTRSLDAEQRALAATSQWALLLRADYRNRHGLRGLRLHQTLVRVVALHYGALIHDPDTLETLDLDTFTRRRLRADAGNVVDQLAIVPFPDPTNDALLRLGTRGMRRFGAVDLELSGLPQDPALLQRGTDLLAGLALLLAREGEVESSGLAVQVPEELELGCALVRQSYAESDYVPSCEDGASALVHLVERRPEAHDPRNHVVARVVAPRPRSDTPDYDHPQWVRATLNAVFGAG